MNFRTETIDWEDARYFLAAMRHGGMSGAARAFGVNHATVSRRIAKLEKALGSKLIERRPNGYALTAHGQAALEAAGAMEAAAERLSASAIQEGGQEGRLSGLARITATRGVIDGFLLAGLTQFQTQNPAIDIELIADNRALSLARREADIALRLGRPHDGYLIARRLTRVRYGLFGSPYWRDASTGAGAPRLIGFDEANARIPEAIWVARRFPGARLVFRADNQVSQALAAQAGLGIVALPYFLASKFAGLVPVMPEEVLPSRELWLATRRDGRHIPHIAALVLEIATLIQKARALFEGFAPSSTIEAAASAPARPNF